ncbi:hypothetical protein [Halorussus ruber]|uniref:hypothetical protein n=1 Tax=Halorussus ruber TaxID=1126238 RepID=UPI00143CF2EC|nr:hypothetical protein [Halorussus ruber]
MRKSATKDDGRSAQELETKAEENEETLVFEGETLAHSPRLGRKLLRWLADRRD